MMNEHESPPSSRPADEERPGPSEGGGPRREGGPSQEEEPVTTGTLFIMILFLMALAGLWVLMYLILLER